MGIRTSVFCSALLLASCFAQNAEPKPASPNQAKTQVVFLGTGAPRPDPARSGPAVLIVANGTPYLVDFGPGVVRRASEAMAKGCNACNPVRITVAFATHLHSDHTAGLSDLFLTPAVVGRGKALELYGPAGIADMAMHIREAYKKDIAIRTEGLEHGNAAAYVMHAHEIKPGVVYKDANVTVTAFLVSHGSWDQAFGYRFDTADRSIVISGDTAPTRSVVENCHGCDVLIHEAYPPGGDVPAEWDKYRKAFHTSTLELAEVATSAKPKLLILYHVSGSTGVEARVEQVKQHYKGEVAGAHDLDIF